ncbi:cellulose biosynthesis protein BcsQ [Photobacterium toruni]|uniref:cellulose biosynthesis protein BcsQ n=1 Tax=Photobacterium toruni TaxID=1935446 RepID=UPI00210FAABC|nr:cellulose biosynthesis protein BcsQ [Photobacterium toruni]
MKRILCVSLRQGCGSTTISANLAQALVKINKHAIAVDIDPANLLRLHLGLPIANNEGWMHHFLINQSWLDACYQSPYKVDVLPFGYVPYSKHTFDNLMFVSALKNLEQGLSCLDESEHESWLVYHGLMNQLDCINMKDFVLSMDVVFVVLIPESINYNVLGQWLNDDPLAKILFEQNKLRFIANQYQPETELGRDFMLVLKQELGDLLSSVIIHRDISLMDCVANLSTIQDYAPRSLAAKDFQSLAFWCLSHLSSEAIKG